MLRNNDDEGKAFYYLGDVRPEPKTFKEDNFSDGLDGKVSVLRLVFNLDGPVKDYIVKYHVE